MARNDSSNIHKKIKEMINIHKSIKCRIILDKNGKIIPDTNEKLKRWTGYIKELFDVEQQEVLAEVVDKESGPKITKKSY